MFSVGVGLFDDTTAGVVTRRRSNRAMIFRYNNDRDADAMSKIRRGRQSGYPSICQGDCSVFFERDNWRVPTIATHALLMAAWVAADAAMTNDGAFAYYGPSCPLHFDEE